MSAQAMRHVWQLAVPSTVLLPQQCRTCGAIPIIPTCLQFEQALLRPAPLSSVILGGHVLPQQAQPDQPH